MSTIVCFFFVKRSGKRRSLEGLLSDDLASRFSFVLGFKSFWSSCLSHRVGSFLTNETFRMIHGSFPRFRITLGSFFLNTAQGCGSYGLDNLFSFCCSNRTLSPSFIGDVRACWILSAYSFVRCLWW